MGVAGLHAAAGGGAAGGGLTARVIPLFGSVYQLPERMTKVIKMLRWLPPAVALVAALTLLQPAGTAYALDRRSGDNIVVEKGQAVDDDLAAAGRLVRIDGTVKGDVYALANTVRVTGVVEGDLIAAAQQVVIDGSVRGDVRAAGALVQLNGVVDHNFTGAAQLLQLASGGRVNGNVVGAGETVAVDGDVGGGLAGAARDVVLQGRVGRNAELGVNSLTIGPSGRIGGNLTYYAQEEQAIPAGAVAGQVQYQHVEAKDKARFAAGHRSYAPSRFFSAVGNFLSLAWLAGSAVVGLVFLRLFPRFAAEFLAVLETRPLPSLGMGALVLIGTLPVAVLVGITIVGLPLAALMVAGYFGGIFLGWLLLAMAAGSILVGIVRKRPLHHSWSFLLGLLVLYLMTRIPVAGGLIWFAGISLGTGAFVLTLHQTWRRKDSLAMPAYSGALPGAAM